MKLNKIFIGIELISYVQLLNIVLRKENEVNKNIPLCHLPLKVYPQIFNLGVERAFRIAVVLWGLLIRVLKKGLFQHSQPNQEIHATNRARAASSIVLRLYIDSETKINCFLRY